MAYQEIIARGRAFTREDFTAYPDFQSDQQKKLPQPPLCKPRTAERAIALPKDFASLPLTDGLQTLLARRKSRRLYADKPVSLEELSFILWAAQGVKSVRGNGYATLRTVPSAGARHPFETYVAVIGVEGLERGFYHYLPLEHEIEKIGGEYDDFDRDIAQSLLWQDWASCASFVLYFSMVPYRVEWRYGVHAHRVALIDLGHIGQNVYLAAEALGRGTCGIGALDEKKADALLSLDGEDEYVVYAQPVGVIKENAERDFLK